MLTKNIYNFLSIYQASSACYKQFPLEQAFDTTLPHEYRLNLIIGEAQPSTKFNNKVT